MIKPTHALNVKNNLYHQSFIHFQHNSNKINELHAILEKTLVFRGAFLTQKKNRTVVRFFNLEKLR